MKSVANSLLLNVNDDESNRYAVTRILQSAGFEVVEAETGEEAIRKASEHRPSLIVLDVKLPDIDGFEVCRRIKADAALADTPVLHLTANALSTENKVQSLSHGADAYLTFPLEPPYVVATIRSLLKIKQVERERHEALARERAKNEELENERNLREQFVATLTHDLRSPLTGVRMSAQLALRRLEDREYCARQLSKVVAGVDRLDQLIQTMLDVSLIRAGGRLPVVPERIDLRALIQEIVDELVTLHGDRFHFVFKGEPKAIVDRMGIRRALENLLQNAIKYGATDTPVRLEVEAGLQGVRFAVHNQGNPIPRELLPTLFEPYRRGAAESQGRGKKGWGLGLTLVRGIVSAHGGEIEATSDEVSGTCFVITVPALTAVLPQAISYSNA